MTTARKTLSMFLALALLLTLTLVPLVAYGWTGDTQGNNESSNSSEIAGEANGETSVHGWIGTFDGEEDPNRPDPPAESWINVKVPTKALFGSLATDEGSIYSPTYHIYNYSVRSVDITPSSFTPVTETDELSGMSLNLDFSQPSSLSIPLRNAGDQFLGNGLTSPSSITLGAGSANAPTTSTFTMNGSLANGFSYPSDAPYQPSYTLAFSFEAGTSASS